MQITAESLLFTLLVPCNSSHFTLHPQQSLLFTLLVPCNTRFALHALCIPVDVAAHSTNLRRLQLTLLSTLIKQVIAQIAAHSVLNNKHSA